MAALVLTLSGACGGDPSDDADTYVADTADVETATPDDIVSDVPDVPDVVAPGVLPPLAVDWIVPMDLGPGMDMRVDAMVNDDGAVVLVGERSGVGDVDPGPGVVTLDGRGGLSAITRFDASGQLAWAFVWPQSFGLGRPLRLAIAPDGTIYVAGSFVASSGVDFDPSPANSDTKLALFETGFVSRFDRQGHYLGTWTSAGNGTVLFSEIAVGSDGALWLTGFLTGDPDLDPSSATHILHGGLGTPLPRRAFLVRWSAAGAWTWGYLPEVLALRRLDRVDGGAMMVSGDFGGGALLEDVQASDLDPGPGLDRPSGGCNISPSSTTCDAQDYWTRVAPDGIPVWRATFSEVDPTRYSAAPSTASGHALPAPDGSGVVIGTYRSSADLDWGPPRAIVTTPTHDVTNTYDLFAAGFSAAGTYRAASTVRSVRIPIAPADARLAQGGYVGRGATFHVAGTMTALAFPADEIGGQGDPAESFLAAYDARGQARWAVGLGSDIDLVRLATSASPTASTVVFGTYRGTTDLDFTAGSTMATAQASGVSSAAPSDRYLIAFHEAGCASGETRPCDCTWDPSAVVVAACQDGIFAACDCVGTAPRLDGTWPPPVVPDCGACPAGWRCDSDTWLCQSDTRRDIVKGLDHPLEALDDGVDLYYIEGGAYPALVGFTPPARVLWRVPRDGGTPLRLAEGSPAHLVIDRGFVYWTDLGLLRTPIGGDGAVERVLDDAQITGPVAFDATTIYVARGPGRITKVLRDDHTAQLDWPSPGGTVLALVSDASALYALSDGAGDPDKRGLQRLSKTLWNGGAWERLARCFDPQGLVDMGDALVFTDVGDGGKIRRTSKETLGTEDVLVPFVGDLRGPIARSGDWVYFARFGLGDAETWTAEVYRFDVSTRALELLASSLEHAVGVSLAGDRLLVVEHGDTRQSTTRGAIVAFPVPP